MSDIWLITPKGGMINGQELVVHVYHNNILLFCMVFMVNNASSEWKLSMWAENIIENDWSFV